MFEDRIIVGFTEPIKLLGDGKEKEVIARIDTGATLSSIDGKLADELGFDDPHRTKRVKNSHGVSIRPVVKVKLIVGGSKLEEEFSIADRKDMKYPVLLGQNVLTDGFVVDPNKGDE